MKILAHTNDGYIIEASRDEVAELGNVAAFSHTRLAVGSQIHLHKVYNRLKELERRRVTLADVAAQLRVVAGALEPLTGVVSSVLDGEPDEKSA